MSRDISLLEPDFHSKVVDVLLNCAAQGYTLRPFFTVRTPWEQAKLWRQSRSSEQIKNAIEMLRDNEAFWLANIIHSVGPQHGKWATNALPGQSWHQWGKAIDCFVLENDRAIWNPGHGGYDTYADEARKLGLTAGHYWASRDSVHVQEPVQHKPDMSWKDIDAAMQAKYRTDANVVEFKK